MSVEDFLSRLKKVRQVGPGRWMCECPAHDDRTASLSVRDDGQKTLINCFALCEREAILGAVGLHWSALFHDHDGASREYRGEYRRESRLPARDVLEALANEALLVAVAAQNIASGVELTKQDLERLMQAAERILTARTMTNG